MSKLRACCAIVATAAAVWGGVALAVPTEEICDCTEIVVRTADSCDDGLEDYIDVAFVAQEVDGNSDSVEQYGEYPEGFSASGRWRSNSTRCQWDRLEARWQDVSANSGRAWGRVTLWPLTLEGDSALISGRAWDAFGDTPLLIKQQVAMDDLKLRVHKGDLEDMRLRFERFDIDRTELSELGDLTVRRLAYQYNFQIGGLDTKGQLRQTATTIDTDVPGTSGKINNTLVKLDTNIDDDLSAYTRLHYAAYEYDDLPDSEMASADWTWGLRYRPDACWLLNAEFRTRENPDDNAVSSHVRGQQEYALSLNYAAGGGSMYEAGYRHRSLDYWQLNMQEPTVFSLLRQPAVITPGQVGPAVTIVTPTYDNVWFDVKQCLTDNLRFTTRFDYVQGEPPGTELVAAGSPSLFFDKRIARSHGLSWVADDRNQLDLNVMSNESQNDPRGSNFDHTYIEGVWSHNIDSCSVFTLALRDTEATLEAPTFAGGDYTTDDTTLVATYGQNHDDIEYALNLAVSDGSGAEDYTQTGAGAAIRFKELGPLGLRVDWYERSYANVPGLNADALAIGVDYRIEF